MKNMVTSDKTAKSRTGVTFIILRPSGEMLVQQRDNGHGKLIPYPHMWCFPGGRKEPLESYTETVIREVREEYNLLVSKEECRLIIRYDHDDVINDHVYICKVSQSANPVLIEGKSMKWMRFREIKKLPLAWKQASILSSLEKILKENDL